MQILEFFGEPLSYGGQESFILNMYKNFTCANKYFFCTPFHVDNREMMSLINERGDKILKSNYNFNSKLRKLYIYRSAKKYISNKYDVIHIHSGSIMTLLMTSLIAKRRGIKKIIVHSHATGYMTVSHKFIKRISDMIITTTATNFVACSEEAGKYKFPINIIRSNSFMVIKNGINLKEFTYNSCIRKLKRTELGISNNKVLCHVGRFSEEKNHKFIIEVFLKYLQLEKNAILMLIGGNGKEENRVNNLIKENGIADKVIILKNRNDIAELLCASDVFIFPSKFEGLGIAAIEAQASGLPTIVASQLPRELNATHNYYVMDLKNTPDEWAKKIYNLQNCKRNDCYMELKKAGYDINDCAIKIEDLYMKD